MAMNSPAAPFSPRMNEREWAAIEMFVRDTVAAALTFTPYKERELLSATAHYVHWAHLIGGTPLERPRIFDRRRIDRYSIVGLDRQSDAARANVRSQLLRIAEALLEPGQFHPRLRPIGPSDPSAPYSPAQVIELIEWSKTQGTDERNDNAAVLLALGMGAGLSGGEIGEVLVSDIIVDSVGVLVHVRGARKRTVPVLRNWERALRERAADGRNAWAFRPNRKTNFPNLISNFALRGYPVATPVQSQRLRSTWLVHHLEAGTPVVPLMTAAGVQSLEALTRYTSFVIRPPAREERAALMNAQANVGEGRCRRLGAH